MHFISCKNLVICNVFILAFVHSSCGIDYLSALRDTVLAAESLFGDILRNVQGFAKQFKTVRDVFDAAVEENCLFKCPVEGVTPKPKYNHVPKPDGCGSLGLKIKSDYLPIAEMTKCCDGHDICYETCNKNKETCDNDFKRCLYNFCDKYQKTVGDNIVKACKGTAKLLFTGTLTFGCKSYLDAQKTGCECPSYGWKDSRNYKREL